MTAEREHRAMKHSLHRAPRAGGKCVVTSCQKTCALDSDYCVHHRILRVNIVLLPKREDDLNVYGR